MICLADIPVTVQGFRFAYLYSRAQAKQGGHVVINSVLINRVSIACESSASKKNEFTSNSFCIVQDKPVA